MAKSKILKQGVISQIQNSFEFLEKEQGSIFWIMNQNLKISISKSKELELDDLKKLIGVVFW